MYVTSEMYLVGLHEKFYNISLTHVIMNLVVKKKSVVPTVYLLKCLEK